MNNDQARAIAGGLQAHSVGGTYPFCVVGIGNGDHHHYEIHNLQTDEVLQGFGSPAKYIHAGFAQAMAETVATEPKLGWEWAARRPYAPEHRRVVPLTEQQRQAREATTGNHVEVPARAYKPAHCGYPGDAIAFMVPADTTGLFPGGDDDHWPQPGVSRYA